MWADLCVSYFENVITSGNGHYNLIKKGAGAWFPLLLTTVLLL